MEKSIYTPEYGLLRGELVNARKNAGLTQRDVAQRLQVPPSWVAKVESGDRRIDLIELCLYSKACDTDPSDLCLRLLPQIVSMQAKRHRKGKRSR